MTAAMRSKGCFLVPLLLAVACDFAGNGRAGADGGAGKADDAGDSGGADVAWAVSRHIWPPSAGHPENSEALLDKDLDLIASLGARYIRTDLWWYVIEPQMDVFDHAALDYYQRVVAKASARGIGTIVILSGAPDWARSLYDRDRGQFFLEFRGYAAMVAQAVGHEVTIYQLWNEPNHVNDFVDGDGDIQLFVNGRQGIRAGLALIGEGDRPIQTAVNLLVDGHDGVFSWMSDVAYYMDGGAADAIDIIAIDHYPGTWSIGDWGGNILDRLFRLGDKYGKAVGVFETGFATARCAPPFFHDEAGQAAWVRQQLPRMRGKLADPRVTLDVPFALVNWYRLADGDSSDCFDPEDNFGILHTDRSPKQAFSALREEIAPF
jgi:hypothetical protein